MTKSEMLLALIKHYTNGNKAKFATLLGISAQGLSTWITRNTFDIDLLYSKCEGVSAEWLLSGYGDMLVTTNQSVPQISFTDGVPYYNETFECGFDELVSPNTENPEYLIQMPGYENATLWCNASGHSMEPEINHGDIIALQRINDFSFLPFGDVYGFVTTNGMRTIKRLGRSVHEGYYKLIPTNKEYDEQEIPISKIMMVYRVMGAMKAF